MKYNFLKKMFGSLLAVSCAGMLVLTSPAATVMAAGTTTQSSTSQEKSMQTPPEKPDGDSTGTSGSTETPPEKPDGDSTGAPNGDGQAPDGNGQALDGQGQPGGGSQTAVTDYDAATEYGEDTETTDETYDSTGTDENALHVSGGKVVLNNATVTRTSSDSTGGDNSSFYGVGAAILTTDGTTYVNGGTVTTDSAGGAGIFSYGDGVTYVAGTVIDTAQDTSGGLHVAGGGTLYAWDVSAETDGESSAAIRSDRGGGTMVIDGGSYISNGKGSPAVYCTADITVNDATLTANGSEGICIEGLNSLRLFDTDLTSNMPDDDQNDTTWSVILYQSMSGDAEEGNATFEMVGGSLTSNNGGLFYTTNTESTFYLNDVDITEAEDCEFFLQATGNSNQRGWGSSGANGADCSFTADVQEMTGDVIWDSISRLDFYLLNGSTLTGAVIDDETNAGNGGDGYCSIYLSSDSTWTVTGDSTVTNLYNEGTIADEQGKAVSIIGSDGTVYVDGDSAYTITVENYSTTVDFSGCAYASGDTPTFADYAVEKPEELTAVSTSADAEEASEEDAEDETESKGSMVKTAAAAVAVAAVAGVVIADLFIKRKKEK